MPNNGRVIKFAAYEWAVAGSGNGSGSGSGNPTYGYSTSGSAGVAPDAVDVADAIELSASSSFNGTSGTWSVYYNGPGAPFGGFSTGGSVYLSSCSIAARAINVTLYQQLDGSTYLTSFDRIDLYVNGSFYETLAGSSLSTSSAGTGPNYIFGGVPFQLSSAGSAGRTNVPTFTYNGCDPSDFPSQDWTTTFAGTGSGGWRFQEMGSTVWQTAPISIYSGCSDFLSASNSASAVITLKDSASHSFSYLGREGAVNSIYSVCGSTLTLVGTDGGNCYNPCTHELGPAYQDVYKSHDTSSGQGARIRLVPDLPKMVKRHKPNYKAFWLRLPLPQVKAFISSSTTTGGVTTTSSSNPIVYPQSDQVISVVGDATHPIENFLSMPTYAITSGSSTTSDVTSYAVYSNMGACTCGPITGTCPDGDPPGASCVLTFPTHPAVVNGTSTSYNSLSSIGSVSNYQSHANPEYNYNGTWGNLHWSYLQWGESWSSLDQHTYWGQGRQQWLYNSALPTDEQRRTRTDCIGSCMEESGHTPFEDAYMEGYRWLGCSRWQVIKPAIPVSKTLDATGGDRWSFPTGESIGLSTSGCTIAPGGTKVTVNVLSFTSTPYMYAAICDKVQFPSDPTNVDSWTAYAVAYDGTKAKIASSAGTFTFPSGQSSKYAGSWAIDNSVDGSVDDEGTDTITASGISATIMGESDSLLGFDLLGSHGLYSIEYDVVPHDATQPVVIPYPTFIAATTTPTMVWESAQICTMLWPNGGMCRFGNWVWYDPSIGLLTVPEIAGAGYKSTVIDALCTTRVVFEARAHDDGLTTQLTQLYDFYEGQSVAVVDKFSISYPLDTAGGFPWALVNTMSEGPPIGAFPNKTWNSSGWTQTGSYGAEVWDWTQEPRYLINAGSGAANLYDASDHLWTGAYTGATIPGWNITQHSHAVTNLEESSFKIKVSSKQYATVSPWRGYAMVLSTGGANPAIKLSEDGQLHLANIDLNGDIRYRWNPVASTDFVNDTNVTGGYPFASGWGRMRIAIDHRTFIEMRAFHTNQGGSDPLTTGNYRMWSTDDGLTWLPLVSGAFMPEAV